MKEQKKIIAQLETNHSLAHRKNLLLCHKREIKERKKERKERKKEKVLLETHHSRPDTSLP